MTSKLSHPSGVYQLSSGSSPLGDLHEPATKQLLVSLITTLNASCPDYDFSGLRADDFEREESTQAAINSINVRRQARRGPTSTLALTPTPAPRSAHPLTFRFFALGVFFLF